MCGLLTYRLRIFEVVAVLLAGEAGAGFVDAFEFTMTHDLCIGVVGLKRAKQRYEGCFLFGSASVGFFAIFIKAAFVTNANRMGIVMTGMNANLVLIASLIELAITFNIVMVANALSVEAGVVTFL